MIRGARLALLAVLLLPAARAARAEPPDRLATLDRALTKAARFLVAAQADDGAWRSETTGVLREGPTLTPYVMSALFFLPQSGDRGRIAFRKGVVHLAAQLDDDGALRAGPGGIAYPVYTAAMASRVVALESRTPRHLELRRRWLAVLRAHRHGKSLGWRPSDPAYGGWGYSMDVPRKPAAGEPRPPFLDSNLSATLFGVAALRSSRIPPEDPAWAEILVFVERCQNFAALDEAADERFDDGGFFFAPGDELQNKAGVAGEDREGRERYHSYGSMTADGVRALLQCGLPATHPRVVAARRWLEREFRADHNPGRFEREREVLRDAAYYYWAWSVAHAFTRLGVGKIERGSKRVDWASELADELLRRQREDGTWTNRFTDAKEDDPLVATPWAASALAICRAVLTSGPGRRPDVYPTLVGD